MAKFCAVQVNKTLPYLVSNVIELLDVDPEELGVEEDGGHVDLDSQRKGKKLFSWKNARHTFIPFYATHKCSGQLLL